MARPLRIERAGAWYHVTARGNEQRNIYRDDKDRRHFCELLADSVEVFGLVPHAYVLMDNHYHLLVETSQANLSRAMQWLNVSYSVWFNRRHSRIGHLFQGRYKSIVVDPQTWALSLSRYVHLNPVRVAALELDKPMRQQRRIGAGQPASAPVVRQRIDRLRQYCWSSYRAYVGLARAPEWLEYKTVLDFVGPGRIEQQRQAYRQYVEAAVRDGLPESPWERLVGRIALGGEEFVRALRKQVQGDEQEQPGLARLRVRPDWERVVRVVEQLKGEKWEVFRDRHGDWGRDLALYLARKLCGMKLNELGIAAGGMTSRAVCWAVTQFGRRLHQDRQQNHWFKQATRKLSAPDA